MNKGRFTSERARKIGRAGAAKSAEARRGTYSAPLCVACLYRIGWGIKRIMRHTGVAKTTVHRFARMHGLTDGTAAVSRRDAWNAARSREAAQRKAAQPKKAKRVPLTKKERNARALAYYYANKARINAQSREYMRRRYNESPKGSDFRIKLVLRSRISNAIKQGGGRKPARTMEITGCTVQQLKAWLESQFCARMSWENYGRAWHIDHIIPCASFDMTNAEHVRQCFHYTNLRPLWARANIRKSDKITNPQLSLLLPAA